MKKLPKTTANHRKNGSVLIVILAAVVVASLIAISYLVYVDNQGERARRAVRESTVDVGMEERVLRLKQHIEAGLLSTGTVVLSRDDANLQPDFADNGWNLQLADGLRAVSVTPFAQNLSDTSKTLLGKPDPFSQSTVTVTRLEFEANEPNAGRSFGRDKVVTTSPEIDVRAIPVSEFTIYAAQSSVQFTESLFSSDMGRVCVNGDLKLAGNYSTDYPLVSGGDVSFDQNVQGSLTFNSADNPVVFNGSTAETTSNDFLADAHTKYNDQIITNKVFPVNVKPAASAAAFDASSLARDCDLIVSANASSSYRDSKGATRYLVTARARDGTLNTSLVDHPVDQTQRQNSGQKNASALPPFLAVANPERSNQVALAFNYQRLVDHRYQSIYLEVRDQFGNLVDAVVAVLGAANLAGPLSIASPHPIIIAGDFNVPPAGVAFSQAASILTSQDVRARAAGWGIGSFGN